MTFISAILALLQAIPILDKWFVQLSLAYAAKMLANHDADFANANIALIKSYDQSLLEAAIGSANAGQSGTDQNGVHDRPIGGGQS